MRSQDVAKILLHCNSNLSCLMALYTWECIPALAICIARSRAFEALRDISQVLALPGVLLAVTSQEGAWVYEANKNPLFCSYSTHMSLKR